MRCVKRLGLDIKNTLKFVQQYIFMEAYGDMIKCMLSIYKNKIIYTYL